MPRAIILDQDPANKVRAAVADIGDADFPDSEVALRVEYSSLNYKDAWPSCAVIRGAHWPMVPGIDGAASSSAACIAWFAEGDRVLLNGWGVGERTGDAWRRSASVRAAWLVPLPAAFGQPQRHGAGHGRIHGDALRRSSWSTMGCKPSDGEIRVMGAAGGVGSVAVSLLAAPRLQGRCEYGPSRRRPPTSRPPRRLRYHRPQALSGSGKPLARERWARSARFRRQPHPGECVRLDELWWCCCGMWVGTGNGSAADGRPVHPARNHLGGVDSVMAPKELRLRAWSRLAEEMDLGALATISREVDLHGAIAMAPKLLAGHVRGRVVVNVNG